MRKQFARTILVAGTVAAAVGFAAPAALAAGTWTVTGGTNFTSAASSGTTFTLTDTTAGDSLKVTSTSGSCAGVIKVNDVVTFTSGTGGEKVTGSPVNPIQISQP